MGENYIKFAPAWYLTFSSKRWKIVFRFRLGKIKIKAQNWNVTLQSIVAEGDQLNWKNTYKFSKAKFLMGSIHELNENKFTCITLIGSPVSLARLSLMCLVGFGVCEKAVLRISNCFAFIVVLGPRLLDPAPPSPLPPPAPPSGLLFSVWLSLVSGSPSKEPSTNQRKFLKSPFGHEYHLESNF